MAIENTYLLGKNITLGCGFDLQAKAPLDSRQTVPAFAGLQALIDGNAAYEGMIVYDEETKKTYQAQIVDDVLTFREFGINEAELKDLIASETTAAMEFKGAATALPENPAKGDMYKVTASFKVGEEDVKVGDSIVYDGTQWFIIPSGDDIEDTWRPVTGVDNDSTLTFVAGDKLEKTVAADGTITYKHEAIDAPTDVTEDGDERTRTYITTVETDGFGHITGYKTATENVEDTNTTYIFTGQNEEGTSVYFEVLSSDGDTSPEVIYLDAYSKNETNAELAKKVDKVEGYSLVADTEIARLADVDNYDDEEVRGLIGDNTDAIDELSEYVGTIPNVPDAEGNNKYADLDVIGYINKKAEETLAAAQGGSSETAASVKHQLDNYKSENNTRVKAAEDAIDAIEADYLKAADKTELSNAIAGVKATADAAAVKSDVDTALAGKVAKTDYEADKATFATKTELGDVDKKFADYKTAADQKLVDDAQDEEIAKKVDKVDGKDLIATSEIERLTTLKNYDDTAIAGRVTTAEGKIAALETESAKHALKTEVEAVDAKFADYTKTADLPTDLGELTNNAGYAKTADVNTELNKKADKTQVATDIANAIAPLATTEALNGVKATAEAAAVKTEVEAALALKADKSVVDAMYTNAQIDGFVAEVKKYADDNDADTKYGIVYDSDNKKIKLVENGTEAEIDATDFIKDGMIESVALSDDGLNLVITWNTDSDKGENNVTTIPLTGLVDIYTGVEGARVKVTVSSDKKVSADIVAGSIGKDYLDEGVKASLALADSAIQSHQDISHLATTEALNGVDAKFANYTNTTDMNTKFETKADKTQVAANIEAAKIEMANQNAVVLAEAQKYADQAKADAIADAEGKVNALAGNVYTKEEVYTKTEVESLLTWGSF